MPIASAFRPARAALSRDATGVKVHDESWMRRDLRPSCIATLTNEALGLLAANGQKRRLLGARSLTATQLSYTPIRYGCQSARVVGKLESRRLWDEKMGPTVTYWLNSLQPIPKETPLFVTLNPRRVSRERRVVGGKRPEPSPRRRFDQMKAAVGEYRRQKPHKRDREGGL
jgi:predicted NAD/FAD-binding protein